MKTTRREAGISSANAFPVLLLLLQGDDCNLFCKIGEFLANYGEYLRLIGGKLPGIPQTGKQILEFFLGKAIEPVVNQAFDKLLQPPRFGGSAFWTLVLIAAAIGFLVFHVRVGLYLLDIGYNTSPVGRFTLENVMKGYSPWTRPDIYLFERYIPTFILTGIGPLVSWIALSVIYRLITDFSVVLYGPGTTLGGVTVEFMAEVFLTHGIIEAFLTFGFFALTFSAFVIMFALEYILFFVAIILMVLLANKFADGKSSWRVVEKPAGFVWFMIVLLGINWVLLVVGIPVMSTPPLTAFPPQARLAALGVMAIVLPIIALIFYPWVSSLPFRATRAMRLGATKKAFEGYPEMTPGEVTRRPLVEESVRERAGRARRTGAEMWRLARTAAALAAVA